MNTHIAIMSVNNTCILKQITTLDLSQTIVTAIEYVRASDTVWMGTNHKRYFSVVLKFIFILVISLLIFFFYLEF